MSGGLKKSSKALDGFGRSSKAVGQALSVGLTLPIVGLGVASIKMASDLDKSMRNVQSVGRQTDEELADLSDTFVQMSTDMNVTTDSALNLADAYFDIQGSGFAGAEATEVLLAATKAASAGITTTSVAAEGITGVINSYGKEASDASDISDLMFRTVDRGVGSFGELTGAMSNVTPTAAALGIDFVEISAAIATMSKQGFTFSEASVSLNQALTSFLKPSTEMLSVINALGFASGQAMLDSLGLAGSMQALETHTGGSTEAMASLFGNVRGMRAAFALTGTGAQKFREDLLAMGDASGATAEAFAIQTQSFDAAWKNFQNTLGALLIEIGQVMMPVLRDFLVNVLTPAINSFRELDPNVQRIIVVIAALVAVLGPLLIILGMIAGAISAISALFSGPALVAVGSFLVAAGPIILLFAGIVAAIVLLSTHWEQLGTTLSQIGQLIIQGLINVGEFIVNFFTGIMDVMFMFLTGDFAGLWDRFGEQIMNGLANGLGEGGKRVLDTITNIIKAGADAVKNFFGIRSPSKLMQKVGASVSEGFQVGIEAQGGLNAVVPQINGSSSTVVPRVSGFENRSMPTFSAVGAGAGGISLNMENVTLNLPKGSTKKQADALFTELAKRATRRGGKRF
jgi:TP901 family phage tail tape measure protein